MRMHMMAALLLVAPWAAAQAQDTSATQMPPRDSIRGYNAPQMGHGDSLQGDQAIVMRLHRINQMEIKAGQLAQRNGSAAKVKSYGQQLVRDHQASDQKITQLAQRLGITLRDKDMNKGRDSLMRSDTTNRSGWQQGADTTDRQGGMMKQHGDMHGGQDADHAQMQRLSSLSGTQFDTEFANVMAQGHAKALKQLEQAQSTIQSAELRTLVQAILPTIRTHLQVAQSLGGSTTTTSSIQ